MNKRTFIILVVAATAVLAFAMLMTRANKRQLLTFTAAGLLRELSIDDKIDEAQLIVIGEVKATLPTKWKRQNEKELEDALPEEIIRTGGIFTDSLISIERTLKGDYREPIVRVRTFQGQTDRFRWLNSSEPSYEKGKTYLLFLEIDTGPTAKVDPGDYISVNAITAVYEIINGKAVSAGDEWALDDLIAYIHKSLSPTPTP